MTHRLARAWPLAVRAPFSLVAVVLGMRLMDEWMAYLPSGAFEAFRADLGLSYRAAATITTLMGVGAIAGSTFSILADTHSRRVIASIGGYGYAASIGAFGLGTTSWVLAAGAIGIGLFSTALVDAIEVAIVDVAGDRLETLLARINVGASVGDLIGPAVLAGVTASGLSWRVALVGSALVMTAFATLVAAAPLPPPGSGAATHRSEDAGPDDTRSDDTRSDDTRSDHTRSDDTRSDDTRSDDTESDRWASLRAAVGLASVGRVWWAGLLGAGLVALDESYLGFIIANFERQRDTSRSVAVILGSASVVGAVVASVWLARRTPVWEPRKRMIVAATIMTITATLFAVLPTLWLPTIAIVVFDAALIGFWLPLQAIALRLVPGRTGATKAVIGAIEMLGLLVPIGIGAVADRAGLGAGLLAFAAVPAAVLVLTLARAPTAQPAS